MTKQASKMIFIVLLFLFLTVVSVILLWPFYPISISESESEENILSYSQSQAAFEKLEEESLPYPYVQMVSGEPRELRYSRDSIQVYFYFKTDTGDNLKCFLSFSPISQKDDFLKYFYSGKRITIYGIYNNETKLFKTLTYSW